VNGCLEDQVELDWDGLPSTLSFVCRLYGMENSRRMGCEGPRTFMNVLLCKKGIGIQSEWSCL
jgi:hypothetical protein